MRFRLKRRQGREQNLGRHPHRAVANVLHAAVVQTHERWLGDSSLQPLVNLVQHHETSYCDIQQFIEKPPGKLRIFEIYPPEPLHSIALGSRIPALREDYKLGRLCGRYFTATVGKLLTEKRR